MKKYCDECKWFRDSKLMINEECTHPQNIEGSHRKDKSRQTSPCMRNYDNNCKLYESKND